MLDYFFIAQNFHHDSPHEMISTCISSLKCIEMEIFDNFLLASMKDH